MAKTLVLTALIALTLAPPAGAQQALTLADAIGRAQAQNSDAALAALDARQSALGVDEARAGFLPRVDFSEAWQRGNQPVYVFGALLTQRTLTEADFAIGRLTRPDALSNYRSAVSIDQPLFDGRLAPAYRTASLRADLATERQTVVDQQLMTATVAAYGRVLLQEALARAAAAAVEAAEADLTRATNRRDAGVATDADVLAVEVHLADVRARVIDARAEARIAREALNHVMGEPLEAAFVLAPPPDEPVEGDVAALETSALASRPDLRIATLQRDLADAAVKAAGAAFLPQVALRGGVEWNGGTFGDRARSWLVGTEIRVNLFNGLGDRARLARARVAREQSAVHVGAVEEQVRLDVRAAMARVEAARARVDVGTTAVRQAREGQRIVRDRYDGGLADIVAVLGAAQAVDDAEAQLIGARVDVVVQRALLDAALGR